MPNPTTTAKALLFGVAAGAMLAWAPIASADDPPPCNPGDARCQQQPPVDPTQFIDPALSAMQQLPTGGNPVGGLGGGVPGVYTPSGVGTGGEVLINGVPTYIPLLRRSRKISRNRSSSREKRYSTSISRSSRLRILPVGLRGSSSRKTTSRGTL